MTAAEADVERAAHRQPSPLPTTTPTTEPIVGETPAADNRKIVSTLIARAALLGIVLVLIDDDAGQPLFIASQGAWTRDMRSTADVERCLAQLGGAPKA